MRIRLDVEDIASSERDLFDAVDQACIGSQIVLTMRGRPVAYLIGVDEYRELASGNMVETRSSEDILRELWKQLVLEDASLSPVQKQRVIDDIDLVGQ